MRLRQGSKKEAHTSPRGQLSGAKKRRANKMDSKTDRPQPDFSVTLKSEGLRWNTLGVTETDRAQERLTDSDSKRNTVLSTGEIKSFALHSPSTNSNLILSPGLAKNPFFFLKSHSHTHTTARQDSARTVKEKQSHKQKKGRK